MDCYTHVYCTECKYGEQLLNHIVNDGDQLIPENCKGCCPWNPEDSFRFEDRPNYIPANE